MSPIDIKELEEKGHEVGTEPRAARSEAVMSLLRKDPKKAHTQAEIGKAVGIRSTHANQILRNLVEKKTVRRASVADANGKTLIYYALSK